MKLGVNSHNTTSTTLTKLRIAGNVDTWKQKIRKSVPSTKEKSGKD